jgi:hypothetical protein
MSMCTQSLLRLGVGAEGWTEIPVRSPTVTPPGDDVHQPPLPSFEYRVVWRLVHDDGCWLPHAVFRVVVLTSPCDSLADASYWELDVRWSTFVQFCRAYDLSVPWSVPFPTIWGDRILQARQDFLLRHLAALAPADVEHFADFVGKVQQPHASSLEASTAF